MHLKGLSAFLIVFLGLPISEQSLKIRDRCTEPEGVQKAPCLLCLLHKKLTDKENYSLKVLDKTQVLKLKGHGLL